MIEYYYEILKADLKALEAVHGIPKEVVQTDYERCATSIDGLTIIFSSTRPLNIGLLYMSVDQARELIGTDKYSAYDI